MPSSMNFEYLREHHKQLAELGAYAEKYAVTDPQSAMVKLRCFVELIVGHVYNELRLPVTPNANIYDKLTSGSFTSVVDQIILEKFHAIRRGGNKAAHDYINPPFFKVVILKLFLQFLNIAFFHLLEGRDKHLYSQLLGGI